MGFEDDNISDNSFETETADLDADFSADRPKKLSRKDLREARKKNAEKTADLPKQKKGLFAKHTRLDDDDSLSGEHLFDPTQETRVSMPREHRSDYDNDAPVRNNNSEFSYLFDEGYEDESDDDFYPDESIYSDTDRAKDLLGGLAYDEKRDGDSVEFDKYFAENSEVRPPSKFSFHKREERKQRQSQNEFDSQRSEDNFTEPEPVKPVKPIKVTPIAVNDNNDNFLPELRSDSVFAPAPEPKADAAPAPETKSEKTEENFMPQESHDMPQDQTSYPVTDIYPPYPMQPMMPMMGGYPMPMGVPMNVPVNIPVSGGNMPQGNMQYQTIPIPYPVMMPYPMYQYPPMYPPYYPQDPYDRYYDDRRAMRRDRRYDDRRDYEYDDRYYDDRGSRPRPSYRPPYESSEYRREERQFSTGHVEKAEPFGFSLESAPPYFKPSDPEPTPASASSYYKPSDPEPSPINAPSYYKPSDLEPTPASTLSYSKPSDPEPSPISAPSYSRPSDFEPISIPAQPVPDTNGFSISDDPLPMSSSDFSLDDMLNSIPNSPPNNTNDFSEGFNSDIETNDLQSFDSEDSKPSVSDSGNSEFSFNFDFNNDADDISSADSKPRGGRFKRRK